jgi:pyruvate formate lyase activating enzyme
MGPDVPLHFSAFHPAWKMTDVSRTPPRTVMEARRIARSVGLRHVYTGNIRDPEGQATLCPGCGAVVVERDGYAVRPVGLAPGGACAGCGTRIAGRF